MNLLSRLLINNMRMELVRLYLISFQGREHIISSSEGVGSRQVLLPPCTAMKLRRIGEKGKRCETHGSTFWVAMGDSDIDDIIDIKTFISYFTV